jgi:hypothetical protein
MKDKVVVNAAAMAACAALLFGGLYLFWFALAPAKHVRIEVCNQWQLDEVFKYYKEIGAYRRAMSNVCIDSNVVCASRRTMQEVT